MPTAETYAAVATRLADLTALEEVEQLLSWDQEITMPRGAAPERGRQMATLAALRHDKATDASLGALLEELAADDRLGGGLNETERANIREALRDYRRATRVPAALVRRWSETVVRAHEIWVDARANDNFAAFAPVLGELVELARERAAAIDPERSAYDVLLDEFEPDMTMARLDPIFDRLKGFLVPFLAEVRSRPQPEAGFMATPVPVDQQAAVGREMVARMGYAFDNGRIDTAVHPFCGGGGPLDVRITTRYSETNFVQSLLALIHETGHALYEQGRDTSLPGQPVTRARSMGVHESQSLLWENQVARSEAFWHANYAWLCGHYPFLAGVPRADFVAALNGVDFNNLIRVEADELTYPMHVILRYEIERDLFAGRVAVADLPALWNAKMVEYLGVRPDNDRLGVLQDIHWAMGAFGYFPSYSLGALTAAQVMAAVRRDVIDLDERIAGGDLVTLREWLRTRIHREGSRYSTDELIARASGTPLSADAFIAYARERYGRLYGMA